jgi:hypothetical protein
MSVKNRANGAGSVVRFLEMGSLQLSQIFIDGWKMGDMTSFNISLLARKMERGLIVQI